MTIGCTILRDQLITNLYEDGHIWIELEDGPPHILIPGNYELHWRVIEEEDWTEPYLVIDGKAYIDANNILPSIRVYDNGIAELI